MIFFPNFGINNIPALVQTRRQTIIWTNAGLLYERIYASLGLNGLMQETWTHKTGMANNYSLVFSWWNQAARVIQMVPE